MSPNVKLETVVEPYMKQVIEVTLRHPTYREEAAKSTQHSTQHDEKHAQPIGQPVADDKRGGSGATLPDQLNQHQRTERGDDGACCKVLAL